ncbi:MmcQ/YjbR family DNA-binding protein [Paenisporosarcina indica]|uniref:MmcQ/YjbR family DNA-binding protein n=1 Tax=Paenisporosarcina indica TaxID=650093 RepID=UPI00094FF530|nr:MmcQ/YjbR family DNA-binding protein [Paenisporosarcina indica]
MELEQLKKWCESYPGAKYDYQQDWQAERYLVGGKMFVMFGNDGAGQPILSLKCDPVRSEVLRSEYEEVNPGYYMNKTHWNSLNRDGGLPPELIQELIAHSYELVFKGLTKKLQKEILIP